jgi:hypothetical protein
MRERTIMLESGQGVVLKADEGGAAIQSDLKNACPYCSRTDCYADCDGSAGDIDGLESEDDMEDRRRFNLMVDGIEAFLMQLHAFDALVASDDRVKEMIQHTLEEMSNVA